MHKVQESDPNEYWNDGYHDPEPCESTAGYVLLNPNIIEHNYRDEAIKYGANNINPEKAWGQEWNSFAFDDLIFQQLIKLEKWQVEVQDDKQHVYIIVVGASNY